MSVNDLYTHTPWGPKKNKDCIAFENRCKSDITDLLSARGFRALPHNVGWELYVIWYFPILENDTWQTKGSGERFRRRDTDGPLKILMDGLFAAIAENDASCIDLHVKKRDGHGSARAELVLQEKELMAELPNTTELAQAINARRTGVRVSTADHPALVDHYAALQPSYGERRLTSFDMWRFHIMDRLHLIFDKIQERVKCPARSGRIDACFECTDMKVMDCVLNNPLVPNPSEGPPLGMFDLCAAKPGLHVRRADREGGEGEPMVDQAGAKTDPQSFVVSIVQNMMHAEESPELVITVLNTVHAMLTSLGKEADPPGKEAMIRVGILLGDAVAVGCPRPLPKPPFWYKDITSTTVPPEYRAALAASGSEYEFAKIRYQLYLAQAKAWREAGSPTVAQLNALQAQAPAAATATAPVATPTAEAPAEGKKRKTKLGKKKDTVPLTAGDLPNSAPVEAAPPAVAAGQLPLPIALPAALAGAALGPTVPPVVTPAGIPGPAAQGMPKLQHIQPSPNVGVDVIGGPGLKQAPAESAAPVTIGLAEVYAELKLVHADVNKVNDNLKKVAAFFAEQVLPEIKKITAGR